MTINEVAGLLGFSREQVQDLIANGLSLPKSGEIVKLATTRLGDQIDISDEQFNAYAEKRDAEEPGRWPPAGVRRELLVEARHACAICRSLAPQQFHHMLDWSKVKHHDARHMLVLCGTCHVRCTNGEIDYKSQVEYKTRLKRNTPADEPIDPHRAKKREEDMGTLADLYLFIPRIFVDQFLEKVSQDEVWVEYLEMLEIAREKVGSTLFHCYDKELPPLFRAFFLEWNHITAQVSKFYRKDHKLSDVAKLALNDSAPHDVWAEYRQFKERVEQAKHAFVVLNSYIRDQYPDFDLDDSDTKAEQKCKARIRKARQYARG